MRRLTACVRGLAAAGAIAAAATAVATDLWAPSGVRVALPEEYRECRAVTADGAGGAWVGFAQFHPRLQRFDASGARLLTDAGIVFSAQTSESVFDYGVVPDGAGGAIGAWLERRTGWNPRVFVQRTDAAGTRLWGAEGGDRDGVVLTTADYWHASNHLRIVADGAGGAVLAWGWLGTELRVQRVDSSGTPQWAEHGNPLATSRWTLWDMGMVPDGTGGAIVAWVDRPEFGGDAIVYATRVDGSGARPAGWPAPGTVLCSAPGARTRLTIASDGAGGAFVLWGDHRTVADDPPLYGHRVRADGTLAWGLHEGLPLATRTSNDARYVAPLAPDGAGGFVAAWQVGSGWGNDTQLVAQRFDANGAPQWNGGSPVALCDGASSQVQMALAGTGTGGLIGVWVDARGRAATPTLPTVRAQRLGPDGAPEWGPTADGVVVGGPAAGAAEEPFVVRDGADGAIVVWRSLTPTDSWDLVAQRVTGGDSPEPGVVSQFVLPTKLTCVHDAKDPEKSRFALTAQLDTGAAPAAMSGPATLTVGGFRADIPGLVADRKGVLRHRGDGIDVAVTPSPAGSSRCTLRAVVKGPAAEGAGSEGETRVGFECGSVGTAGTCLLVHGRYARGGILPEMPILPTGLRGRVSAPGKDSFTAAFAFSPEPALPAPADVEFALGEAFRATVPAASFVRKGWVVRSRGVAGSVPAVTIDFRRGTATVSGRNLDLDAFAEGGNAVRLTLGRPGETVTTEVRIVRKGKTLTY